MAAGFVDDEGRRREGHGVRGTVLRHGGDGRRHLRLRHQHRGRRVVHGVVPKGLITGSAPADGGRRRWRAPRQQLLQVRQLAADALHLVALHLRPAHLRAPPSWVTASRGRRASMILGGFAYIAGVAASGTAVNVSIAILGRAFLGVGLGFTTEVTTLKKSNYSQILDVPFGQIFCKVF
ncbi:hypothetical protein OsI_18621 [Oryza sativa Indica Group]|uniref:Major facilitator superfamily (MFS) profile domain-containing protein n=3 Tax=Oryza TaxID=4527 RepID=B9FHY2_ORYSJ|nr:hypothetical protein OsI_18621 [Oryza sativa Indica Group]EEE62482.1 hypothetical protein OsJ_17279 [Oryza sativa Japonica Group]